MDQLPIVYLRGFAGATTSINEQVDDPFYGFNTGATHIRTNGDGDPSFYQFEGPLLRLMVDHGYQLLVHGSQRALLQQGDTPLAPASIWIHRFYDSAATTFAAPRPEGLLHRLADAVTHHVASPGFNLEAAAADLYTLVLLVLRRTGAPKVILVAHSMGGLVARCMMQKVCESDDADGQPRRRAADIVDKLFTFGTPHGGIVTLSRAANAVMADLGPAGSDIFAPDKMYGLLTPGSQFGDLPPQNDDRRWDPRVIPADVFDVDNVFCIVGTDPADYGPSRLIVGAKSDGLVRIENAYVKGSHRAFIYKSHSGAYGEVNSEEAYQNLQRFLFGRWAVSALLSGLADTRTDTAAAADQAGVSWQADMRLTIRGLPVVISQQLAEHWCPIMLDQLGGRPSPTPGSNEAVDADRPLAPVPLVSTFLLERTGDAPAGGKPNAEGLLCRYVVTLRVAKVVQANDAFDFTDHLEGVPDWSDSLVVDVGPTDTGGLGAYTGWNSAIPGALDLAPRMPNRLMLTPEPASRDGRPNTLVGQVDLPDVARSLSVFGPTTTITIRVGDRRPSPAPSPIPSPTPAPNPSS
ncbi:hypothetical protein BA895_17905 [Humibacillus sp. DSM 29435]|uniref:esterase/lipase family protein n=1 Tax=Humibacillus sp. DSM 29435 TaxID=1869167 RepID=UPI000872E418|nr:hypothetical protein [Humibacillus sp. DSM 29435]OFE17053.1 hypothetical protein BA895_17905 [Humibacillus sp. DSM 29435]